MTPKPLATYLLRFNSQDLVPVTSSPLLLVIRYSTQIDLAMCMPPVGENVARDGGRDFDLEYTALLSQRCKRPSAPFLAADQNLEEAIFRAAFDLASTTVLNATSPRPIHCMGPLVPLMSLELS